MGWEGIIPNGSLRGERCSGSEKHRKPEFPTGEVGRVQWLSTARRMLFSARQPCAARPSPPVSSQVSQEPGAIRKEARKERGGRSRQIAMLAGSGAHCSKPAPLRPASQPVCPLQKDAQGSAWTSGCFQALCSAESPCAHITSLGG